MAFTIPPHLAAYRQTPMFDERTMPAGLRRQHQTKAGVWGKICVVAGRLKLTFLADGSVHVLDPAQFGVVGPNELHEAEPLGPVRFFIEFYAAAPLGAPHENADPSLPS